MLVGHGNCKIVFQLLLREQKPILSYPLQKQEKQCVVEISVWLSLYSVCGLNRYCKSDYSLRVVSFILGKLTGNSVFFTRISFEAHMLLLFCI